MEFDAKTISAIVMALATLFGAFGTLMKQWFDGKSKVIVASFDKKNAEQNKEIALLKDEISDNKQITRQLKKELDAEVAKRRELQEKVTELEGKIQKLLSENSYLKSELEAKKKELAKANKEIAILEKKLSK